MQNFTQAELAVIYFALVDSHNKLLAEKKDTTKEAYLLSIIERQYTEVLGTLSTVQAYIEQAA
jgi:hypothetical protein